MTHKAIVAKIDTVMEIPGADNIQVAIVLNTKVIVAKDWNAGMMGLFFPSELQLSEEFCHNNNLFRHAHLNKDVGQAGFFEDNRRVKSQTFLRVKSDGFFTTLDSIAFAYDGSEVSFADFKIGDSFDEINGIKICEKYISPKTKQKMMSGGKKKTAIAEAPMFHKHPDTEQFKHVGGYIAEGALLSFHAKVHGTSARYSYSKVIRKPKTLWQKFKARLGLFNGQSWDYLVGTRNVVLYDDQYNEGYHGSEQFRFDVLDMLKPSLEKGMTIYGEIAGYANDATIMPRHHMKNLKDKKYTKKYGDEITYKYGCTEGAFRFHVYRISYINESGNELDFTDKQLNAWCQRNGLLGTHEVHPSIIYDGDRQKLQDLVEELTERPDKLTEDYIDPSHISEGIVVRVDSEGQVPKFYKNKSFAFKVLEGISVEEEGDMEDAA